MYFSSEVGYSQVHTAVIDAYRGTTQAKWRRLPILLWTKLTTQNSFSPYVRVGFGASQVEFQETYSSLVFDNIDLKYWAFAWGGGAGIEWLTSDRVRFAFFVDYISAEGTQTQIRPDGSEDGIFVRSGVLQAGIRTEVAF